MLLEETDPDIEVCGRPDAGPINCFTRRILRPVPPALAGLYSF
jgi:hypothetical protein